MKYVAGVYIIGLQKQGRYCKIGVTSNIENRLKALSTASPFVPYLYHMYDLETFESAWRLESESHVVLSDHRVNGEWFKISPGEAEDKIRHLFPKRVFPYEPINLPDTMDGLSEHTANRRAKDAAKKTLQDTQAPEAKT